METFTDSCRSQILDRSRVEWDWLFSPVVGPVAWLYRTAVRRRLSFWLGLLVYEDNLEIRWSHFWFISDPVDGSWSSWSDWSQCSQTCSGGTESRERDCTRPAPAFGGRDCVGERSELRRCNSQPCSGGRHQGIETWLLGSCGDISICDSSDSL